MFIVRFLKITTFQRAQTNNTVLKARPSQSNFSLNSTEMWYWKSLDKAWRPWENLRRRRQKGRCSQRVIAFPFFLLFNYGSLTTGLLSKQNQYSFTSSRERANLEPSRNRYDRRRVGGSSHRNITPEGSRGRRKISLDYGVRLKIKI